LLTPVGLAEKTFITARFLARKMREYEALKVEIAALKVEVAQTNKGSFAAAAAPTGAIVAVAACVGAAAAAKSP